MAGGAACEGGDGDGGVGRAVDGGSCLRDRLPGQFGHDGEAYDVGGFALIGRHAKRGVAFQMFDRAEAFLMRKLDVFDGDIVLLVDPGTAFAGPDIPERSDGGGGVFGCWQVWGGGGEAKRGKRFVGCIGPGGEGGMGGEMAVGCPSEGEVWHAIWAGSEGGDIVIPDRAATVVA